MNPPIIPNQSHFETIKTANDLFHTLERSKELKVYLFLLVILRKSRKSFIYFFKKAIN